MDLPSTWDDLRKQLQASQTWALRNWCKCCTWAIPPEKHIFSHVANWKLPWVRPTWQARKLEGQLDEQLTSYRRVANTKGEGSEQDHEAGIERLLQQLQHVNTQMQVWVASESSDILSHTLTRHREIFHDLSQEFNRLRSSLRARREHTALLENFSKFDHASSDLERNTDSAEQALLKEQATLQRSTVQIDNVVLQAQATLGALMFQRSTFGGISSKISNIGSRLPSVNHILSAIRRKKSMDTIILSLVASTCTVFILIYWLSK